MRRLDPALLSTLDVLLEERNVTRAAKRLNLSQPAVSAQLARLREQLGDPLLVPSGRAMVPTARAEALRDRLRTVLSEIDWIVAGDAPFDPNHAERTFRIVASDAIHDAVTAPFAAALPMIAPRCRVAMLGYRNDVIERMARGEVDLFLGAGTSLPDLLIATTLYEERFLCVLRRGHPLASKPLTIDEYVSIDHVLVSPGGAGEFEGTVDAALARSGRTRRVSVSLSSFLLVPSVLEGSQLIATVPSRIAERWRDDFVVLAPPLEVPGFSVRMGWHPRSQGDTAAAWLRTQLAHSIVSGPPSASKTQKRNVR
jgi:DNA-binding transcriptional LysR family regulator